MFEDPALTAALTRASTDADLFARVIEIAHERGLRVTSDELAGRVRINQQAWLERWLV